MSTFEERGEGFEKKFALDAEKKFKAEARRNKLIAEWAAQKLGVDSQKYTDEVVKADLTEAGDEDVIKKLKEDFENASIQIEENKIRTKLDELMAIAIKQIEAE